MTNSRTFEHRNLLRRRKLPLLFLTLGLGLATITPATAQEAGAGVGTGTENQIDAGDPPVNGTADDGFLLCARAQDNDYVDPDTGLPDGDDLSAKYTIDATGTFTAGAEVYEGPFTINIETTETFYFGPQGTHYGPTASGNNCGADNLGRDGKIPATITITDGADLTCDASLYTGGSFWRTTNVFEAEVTATCTVNGNVPGADGDPATSQTTTSTVKFTGDMQPPCTPLAPCIVGTYTQQ